MRHRPAAFTLVELLFAIATLSIGLTGVAAALYVGIGQTKITVDDTQAAVVARQAAAALSKVMTAKNTPATDLQFQPLFNTDPTPDTMSLYDGVRGSQISSDGTYAWVPVYRRIADTARYAELVIVVVRAEARSRFNAEDVVAFDPDPSTFPPTLVAAKATIQIENNQAVIRSTSGSGRLAPGSAVVLTSLSDSKLAGRVIRLSEQVSADTWTLQPGQDVADAAGPDGGTAYVVGRGYADPRSPSKGYAGGDQVVATYSTIVTLGGP